MKSTHTLATLEVSAAAYDEIAGKLRAAEYGHAFIGEGVGLVKDARRTALATDALAVRDVRSVDDGGAAVVLQAALDATEATARLGVVLDTANRAARKIRMTKFKRDVVLWLWTIAAIWISFSVFTRSLEKERAAERRKMECLLLATQWKNTPAIVVIDTGFSARCAP